MKDVIYSIPIDDFIDRVNAADTELVKDRSDEYLLDSNLWTDSEHILANACLNLDDARNMGMDTVRRINIQYLIDELVSLYGNPSTNNLRFDSLVWCSNKAMITKEFTVSEITDSLSDGIWYCVPESGFDGVYFLSEESQDTLNYLRKFGKLKEIVNANNE